MNLISILRRNRKLRGWIKKFFYLYDMSDLVIGGHCGCCGASMPDEIFEKDWNWGLCEKCKKGDVY